jgi:hypothetical protein
MLNDNTAALQSLASALKIALTFNEDDVCDLVLNGDALVTLEGDPQGTTLRINGVVGTLPDPQAPQALQLLLQANFNGQGTGPCSLGLDHVSGEVVLGLRVDVTTLGETGLQPVVGELANYLIYWRDNLLRLLSEESMSGVDRSVLMATISGMLA